MDNLLADVKRILDKDEEIKFSYRPNMKRFLFVNLISSCLFILLVFSFPFIFGLLGLIGVTEFVNDDGTRDMFAPLMIFLIGSMGYIFLVVSLISSIVKYNKTIYVVTNKKVIIRSGFIGADFNSMNLSSIGLLNVRVDFLDKLVRPNPGTIEFANASTPVVNQNNRQLLFRFAHIDNPYETYQEIKDYIDSVVK